MFLLSNDFWEIRETQDRGRGVFVRRNIKAGTVLGDYIGMVINIAEDETAEDDIGLYLMHYHENAAIYPSDVTDAGVHLINHSCTPNAAIYIHHGHTIFFALRKIFRREEVTISYMLCPIEFCDECIHNCRCNSKLCTGSMHLRKERFSRWRRFIENQALNTRIAPVTFNEELKKLPSYPKNISDEDGYDLFGSFLIPSITYTKTATLSVQKIREIIRETGRTIELPQKKMRILGVQSGKIISEKITNSDDYFFPLSHGVIS